MPQFLIACMDKMSVVQLYSVKARFGLVLSRNIMDTVQLWPFKEGSCRPLLGGSRSLIFTFKVNVLKRYAVC